MSSNGSKPPSDNYDQDKDKIIRFPSLADRDRVRRELEEKEKEVAKTQKPTFFNIGSSGMHGQARTPFFNLPAIPPLTKILAVMMVIIHVAVALMFSAAERYDLYLTLGFVPARFTDPDLFTLAALVTPVAYMALHGGWLHLAMNSVFVLAFGTITERWIGQKRMILLLLVAGLGAAGLHFILNPTSTAPLIGFSGALSGLFAAALVMLYSSGRIPVGGQYGILPLAIVWIAIFILMGSLGGPGSSAATTAWDAHVGGFVAGLIFFRKYLRVA